MRRAVCLFVLFWCGAARADEYHYQNFLLGERAMGMGGAYTALGAGPSSAWYNPAGLGFLEGTSFSVQTGVYGTIQDSTAATGGFVHGDGGQFLTFPSTAVIVKKVGGERHKVGLAILTPDFDYRATQLTARDVTFRAENGSATFGSYSLVQDDRDTTLWFGPTYGVRLHPRVAIGATLFFTLRSRDLISKIQASTSGIIQQAAQFDLAMKHIGILGMAGIRIEPFDHFFVGATFRTPNARVAGSATVSLLTFNAEGSPRVAVEDVTVHYRMPWRASFGVGYAVPRRYGFGVDLSVHGAVDPYTALESPDLSPALSEIAKKQVANVNAGLEYYLGGVVPLRLGFFTNFSAQATPRPEVRDLALLGMSGVLGGQGTAADLYGITGGVGFESGGTTLTLGVNYVFGGGTTVLGDSRAERVLRLLLVGIAGSYGF